MNSSNVSRIERKQVFAKFNDYQESNKDKKTSDYSRVISYILDPRDTREYTCSMTLLILNMMCCAVCMLVIGFCLM